MGIGSMKNWITKDLKKAMDKRKQAKKDKIIK
jgi:hypothetical protein